MTIKFLPTTLVAELKAAGLVVRTIDNWQTRTRPSSTGGFDPEGVLVHHTGSKQTNSDLEYAKWLFLVGRSDLPAPLCQVSISRNGTVYLGAAGRGNHAGKAKASGPIRSGDGNELYIGIECMNDGSEGWSKAQRDALVKTCAVLCEYLGVDGSHVRGHKETSVTGKWDPGKLDMNDLRKDVSEKLKSDHAPRYARPDNPKNRKPTRYTGPVAYHKRLPGYRASNSYKGDNDAARRGFRAIDKDFHLSKDGEPMNTHWALLSREGFLPRTNPATVHQLNSDHIADLRTKDGYAIHTARETFLHASLRKLRVEFEAKECQGFEWGQGGYKLFLELKKEAKDTDTEVVFKTISNLGDAKRRLMAAHRAGFTTILLPRGTRRVPKDWWPFIDHVRGPVWWV